MTSSGRTTLATLTRRAHHRGNLPPLRTHEIEVAVADVICQEDVDAAQTLLRIQYEHEQVFVDEHMADLEALAAALEAVRR